MPRGVYNRSKVAAAKAAAKPAKTAEAPVVKRAYKRRTPDVGVGVTAPAAIPAQELRDHTSFLVSLRSSLSSNTALLAALDTEIKEMLEKTATWRKESFKTAPPAPVVEQVKEPIPPPSKAAPVPLSQPVAPIPFTPANVQELQKAPSA